MKPTVVGIAVAAALAAAAYLFLGTPAMAPVVPPADGNTYASETYGLSFTYPDGYILSEETIGEGQHTIVLIREEDAVPVVAGGEGPTAITVNIYGVSEGFTLLEWLAFPDSNFQISDGTHASTTVDGVEAVHYGWSGLYEGETSAFMHEGNIIAASVTYRSPTDPIRAAYEEVLDSLRLR